MGEKNERKIRPGFPCIFSMVLAALCLIYLIATIIFSGFSMDRLILWVVLSAIFSGLSFYSFKIRASFRGLPRFIPTFIFTSVVLLIVILSATATLIVTYPKDSGEHGHTDFLIVMGGVIDNGMSDTLRNKLSATLSFAREHPETTLLIMGGQDPGDATLEGLTMLNYLNHNGVPMERMIINASVTDSDDRMEEAADIIERETRQRKALDYDLESMENASNWTFGTVSLESVTSQVLESDFGETLQPGLSTGIWPIDYLPKVALLTSDYQMFRSVRLLKHFGIENPDTISTSSDRVLFLHNVLIESTLVIRDFLLGRISLYPG